MSWRRGGDGFGFKISDDDGALMELIFLYATVFSNLKYRAGFLVGGLPPVTVCRIICVSRHNSIKLIKVIERITIKTIVIENDRNGLDH